ncbi:hypothetical protein [Kitasatospora sp. NPDC051705]|uniref:hypothetical protein n=1 Tax=Kitasatospora sp. NPDC051705 TaxID=3364057 RepID=UPI00379B90A4
MSSPTPPTATDGGSPTSSATWGTTPPHEPGTAAVSAAFTLTGLTHEQAAEATERARRSPTGQGWTVGFHDVHDGVRLKLTPPTTCPGSVAENVFVGYYDRSGFFTIDARAEGAHHLGDTPVDYEEKPEQLACLRCRLRSAGTDRGPAEDLLRKIRARRRPAHSRSPPREVAGEGEPAGPGITARRPPDTGLRFSAENPGPGKPPPRTGTGGRATAHGRQYRDRVRDPA